MSHERVAHVASWLADQQLLSPSLRVVTTPHGLGVETALTVDANSLLLRVPLNMQVTSMDAEEDPSVSDLLQRLEQPVEPYISMAVWLLRTMQHPPEHLEGWIASLPRTIDCALGWSEAELALLQRSPSASRLRYLRGWVDEQYSRMIGEPSPPVAGGAGFITSRRDFNWAVCVVWSRSFHLPCPESSHSAHPRGCRPGLRARRVLAAGAGLFNHDARLPKAKLIEDTVVRTADMWNQKVRRL